MALNILMPRIMEIGGGALERLAETLRALNVGRPLIVTDRMMIELGYVDRAVALLSAADMHWGVFSGSVTATTEHSIMAGVEVMKQGFDDGQPYDSVIAIGGGSAIDAAKVINVLTTLGGGIRDYQLPKHTAHAGCPLIVVPTTAGAGSECTRSANVTEDATGDTVCCAGLGFTAIAAIIDHELSLSVSARQSADTGIHALSQAIEAYISRQANPFSDQQALAAMRLIGPNLRAVYHQPHNRRAREAMMLGASLAGLACSSASAALVRGMSQPISALFHVPHGLSHAMLLPAITRFSIDFAPARYAVCARTLGAANRINSDAAAVRLLNRELLALAAGLRVPLPADYGIDREQWLASLDAMAEQALASGLPAYNPRVPAAGQIVELYERAWDRRV